MRGMSAVCVPGVRAGSWAGTPERSPGTGQAAQPAEVLRQRGDTSLKLKTTWELFRTDFVAFY